MVYRGVWLKKSAVIDDPGSIICVKNSVPREDTPQVFFRDYIMCVLFDCNQVLFKDDLGDFLMEGLARCFGETINELTFLGFRIKAKGGSKGIS